MAKDNLDFGLSVEDIENAQLEYNGEDLPSRKIVNGVLDRAYLTHSDAGNPMMKVLYKSTHPDYDGFPVWENVPLTPKGAFKWAPMIEAIGVDVADLSSGIKVDRDSMSDMGLRVESIGPVQLDGTTRVQFSVKYEKFKSDYGVVTTPHLQMLSGPNE